jgi:hypothetical protein
MIKIAINIHFPLLAYYDRKPRSAQSNFVKDKPSLMILEILHHKKDGIKL